MDAIEFNTTIEPNGIIQLPDEYKNIYKGQVKVIVLKEEDSSTKEKVELQYAKLKATIKEIQD
ncbi:hypothetical protein AHMF7605_13600 [Adhaeribacter arboris]|uniref:Uncharacterized protein n=1 Tax=Adhaeribacter arboris TaxID=2072846 RepID=A0A2T2YG53_9BACT|nr:hypothetical protein [Adhaeribacter arboris]PSR54473.1 hypothetical protein AHMF7605_13600 [Adhaeribacter arboris]